MTVLILCCATGGAWADEDDMDAALRPPPGVPYHLNPSDSEEIQAAWVQTGASYWPHLLNSAGCWARPTRCARPASFTITYDKALKLYAAGQYASAIEQGDRALMLAETVLGSGDPAVASCLDLLGTLYGLQGAFARAEPLLQRALAMREEALDEDHPDIAVALNNLANLFYSQGLYARAEPLYARALVIREESLHPNHPDTATSLNNLALIYQAQGVYARAEPLYKRALAMREESLDEDHPDIAAALNNLANLYEAQGLHARAEPLLQRALAIWEQALGRSHPDVAAALNNLANLYEAQGLYARAEPLYTRALAIWEQTLGQSHPDVARSLNNLAQLYLVQHRLAEALRLFTRAFSLSEQRLRQEALSFSESRLTSFLQHLRTDEERLYALLRAYPEDEDVRRLVLSVVLLRKGRSAEELADTSRITYRGLGAEDRKTFEQLRGLRSQLATLSLQGPGTQPLVAYQQRLRALAHQGDALEADLARRSAPLRTLTTLPALTDIIDQVAASLPPDSALVEFIAYVDRPLLGKPDRAALGRALPLRYLALVLLPNADIRAIDLGPAEPIDRAALNLRTALAHRDDAFEASAQALYQLTFQPLLPLLGDTRRLFLSPDGQLGLVPFAALHDGQQFLIDCYHFTYLTSGRDLLLRSQEPESSGAVVVLADPAFGPPRSAPVALLPGAERSWGPLPGTREEAQAIQRLIPEAQVFLGPEATKERLLQLRTPGVLHLATHGFFLEDAPAAEGSRGVVHFGALGEGLLAQRLPDPLLRSGIVLAGGHALAPQSAGAMSSPLDSSLVTALELAGSNLWGTELVVLSACDTGRGDVKLGQGVYGLRRALVVAGAETVVMSLWKVRDDSTWQLMEAYYRNLLAGQGRSTALLEAMKSLRLAYPHPHDWAPFIALGREAPLRALAPGSRQLGEEAWLSQAPIPKMSEKRSPGATWISPSPVASAPAEAVHGSTQTKSRP
jgi:CHAT domain-containing protein/Tfp pilus assembly protein PilF